MRKKLLKSLVIAGVMMMFPMSAMAADGDVVAIDDTNFPDETFRTYVSENFDSDKDGVLSQEEMDKVTSIVVSGMYEIESLEGIEHFSNLIGLYCDDTGITELDVSGFESLGILYCGSTNITALDVSSNDNLEILYCNNTGITTLDVSKLTELVKLNCSVTNISVLDVAKLTELTDLNCSNTSISELDVEDLINLETLQCGDTDIEELNVANLVKLTSLGFDGTKITELDVSMLTELTALSCGDTEITELDVSKLTKLIELYCANTKITSLDVSKNTELIILECSFTDILELDITNNTKLEYLYCSNTGITSLDTSNNTNLEELYWDGEDSSTDSASSNVVTDDLVQALVDASVDKENIIVSTDEEYIVFSQDAIEIITGSIVETLSITMGDVEIVLDSATLQSIQEQISGDVFFIADYIETELLPDEYLAIAGDRPVYVFYIYDQEGNEISDFDGGSITVTVPYTLGEDETEDNLVIYYLVEAEILETIEIDSYDAVNELLTFTVTHFSTYAVGYEEDVVDANTDTDDTATDDTTTDDTITSPETGDTANIMLYVILAVLACGGIAVITKRRMV